MKSSAAYLMLALALSVAGCSSDSTVSSAAISAAAVGDSCAADADCGAGATCLTAGFPGGLCTAECSGTVACPDGSLCASLASDANTAYCAVSCNSNDDCRNGYTCNSIGVCNPPTSGTSDAGTDGSGDAGDAGTDVTPPSSPNIGAACATAAECAAPGGLEALCLSESNGFPAGTCSAACDPAGANTCGDGAACLPTSVGGRCVSACTAETTCRTAYECCNFGAGALCLPDGLLASCTAPAPTPVDNRPAPGEIAASCVDDSECTVGPAPVCFAQFGPGLCTSGCADDADCGVNGVCGDVGGGQTFCFRSCTAETDCAVDFVCCDVGGASICLDGGLCR